MHQDRFEMSGVGATTLAVTASRTVGPGTSFQLALLLCELVWTGKQERGRGCAPRNAGLLDS